MYLETNTVHTRASVETTVKKAVQKTAPRNRRVEPRHTLVTELGFDSLRLVTLSLALEETFEQPLLLNDWLACASDPSELTVASLSDFIWDLLQTQSAAS